jgi:hypothetical protein
MKTLKTTNNMTVKMYEKPILVASQFSIFESIAGDRFLSWGNPGHQPQIVELITPQEFEDLRNEKDFEEE